MLYDVPSATQALIISGGFSKRTPENPFRVVVGGGAWSVPLLHRVNRFHIGAYNVPVKVSAPSQQNIMIDVEANIVFRVAADTVSITAAASRFMDVGREEIENIARDIFGGETRGLIGNMSVEEIISDRMRLAADVISNAAPRMQALGWQIDSYQISSISDRNGHIENLSKPELARVEREAEVAAASARAEIEAAKQEEERRKSLARKETEIQVSENTKETAQARAEAAASGPKAEAEARIAVALKEAELAQARAKQREEELVSEVIKPAEAEARRRQIEAEAEAEAIRKIAEAISSHDGISLDKAMVDNLPEITGRIADALSAGDVTFLGSGKDLNSLIAEVVTVAGKVRSAGRPEAALGTPAVEGPARSEDTGRA